MNAAESIGIEIEIVQNNNIPVVQSNSCKRFKVKSFDELTNTCTAEEYEDEVMAFSDEGNTSKEQDLLMSELYELKGMWYQYTKKINSLLVILP